MSRVAEYLAGKTYESTPRSPKLMPEGIPLEVCVLFQQFALRAIATGVKRYSADAILHRIRWEEQIERGIHDFKVNNNWTSHLARWFIANHPDKASFFETRKLKEERDAAV
jgi:hypothetical protein